MTSVTAAGGVLYRKSAGGYDVLLIRRNGVWDLPKGKMEEGETTEECGCREVAEEVGIPLPEPKAKLTTTYHEYKRNGDLHGKTTHWFSMQTRTGKFTPQRAEGITDVAWMPLAEAREAVEYENLRKVLLALKNQLE